MIVLIKGRIVPRIMSFRCCSLSRHPERSRGILGVCFKIPPLIAMPFGRNDKMRPVIPAALHSRA